MQSPLSCAACLMQVTNFLWLNCSHHICLPCAKTSLNSIILQSHIDKEQQIYKHKCPKCQKETILNQETLTYLTDKSRMTEEKRKGKGAVEKIKTNSNIEKNKIRNINLKSKVNPRNVASDSIKLDNNFCLNCMEQVPLDFRKFHKDHRIITQSLCLLQIQHLLQHQQTKLLKIEQKLNDQIMNIKLQINEKRQYRQDLCSQLNHVFREISREIERMKEKMTNKLNKLTGGGEEELEKQLQKKEEEKEGIIWLGEEIKIALEKKEVGFIKEQFNIIQQSRKISSETNIETIKLIPKSNIRIEIDDQLINRSLNLIQESIHLETKKLSFPLKQNPLLSHTTQKPLSNYQPSLSIFSTSKNTNLKVPSNTNILSSSKKNNLNDHCSFFESLKTKVFTCKTLTDRQREGQYQKLDRYDNTNQKQKIFGKSHLGEITNMNMSSNTRVSRFASSYHHMSVKEEINHMSREFREKSQTRKEKQKDKDKENCKNTNKKLITILL